MAAGHDTFHHIRDFSYFELPFGVKLPLPEISFLPSPEKIILKIQGDLPETESILGLQISKFMLLQVVAGLLTLWIFRGLSKQAQSGKPVTGRWWNFWEMLALFIRDEVVRPTIGDGHHGHDHEGVDKKLADDETEPLRSVLAMSHGQTGGHPADKFLPLIWSCFFYVLFCNLLGAIPWLGSATAEINVTGALAVVAIGAVVMYGSAELGPIGFWKNLVPGMELPAALKVVLVPMIWLIELLGLFIKHGVLAVRLFANIMAGHTVIAVILGFIGVAAGASPQWLYYLVLPASIFGQVGIGMLELFVSFLQAYIFAFLTTLFIGAAIHEH